MTDVRKCCILGLCCPPGSAAQRADLKAWLLEKVGGALLADYTLATPGSTLESEIDSWLDELPWEQAGE